MLDWGELELLEEEEDESRHGSASSVSGGRIDIEQESFDGHGPASIGEDVQIGSLELLGTEGGHDTTFDDIMEVDTHLVMDDSRPIHVQDPTALDRMTGGQEDRIPTSPSSAKRAKVRHASSHSSAQLPAGASRQPQIPTLHLSNFNLRLFDANNPGPVSVYCSDLLSFQRPMYYRTHPAVDRLNMTQYVPDLGVVVIGSQIGRVAVCSLTRKGANGPFGLRIDWILPLLQQEVDEERPRVPLLGIAVGPVHGHEVPRTRFPSVSEDGQHRSGTWLQDRTDENGVSITFDPGFAVLRRDSSDVGSSSSGGQDYEASADEAESSARAEAGDASHEKSIRSKPSPLAKQWKGKRACRTLSKAREAAAMADEPWRGIEYSRRYRLMLTYNDQTVLTYELSRAAPYVGDAGQGIPNWRNID